MRKMFAERCAKVRVAPTTTASTTVVTGVARASQEAAIILWQAALLQWRARRRSVSVNTAVDAQRQQDINVAVALRRR